MKPEFKMIIFISIGVSLLLLGLYYGQYDVLIKFIKAQSTGGIKGIPIKSG